MICQFRHVDELSRSAVTLHLFRTLNGSPRADVSGPHQPAAQGGLAAVFEMTICMPLAEAFASAVRMANKNDAEMVVTGEASLWQPSWGSLVDHRVAAMPLAI